MKIFPNIRFLPGGSGYSVGDSFRPRLRVVFLRPDEFYPAQHRSVEVFDVEMVVLSYPSRLAYIHETDVPRLTHTHTKRVFNV